MISFEYLAIPFFHRDVMLAIFSSSLYCISLFINSSFKLDLVLTLALVMVYIYLSFFSVSEIDPCSLLPCQNGATCQRLTGFDYICQCPPGFSGTDCDIGMFRTYTLPCEFHPK